MKISYKTAHIILHALAKAEYSKGDADEYDKEYLELIQYICDEYPKLAKMYKNSVYLVNIILDDNLCICHNCGNKHL